MGYERPYYEDLNYHPFLFYIVFGTDNKNLDVSRERHRVDELPDGLDFSLLKKPENDEYMDALIGGTLGKVLNDNYCSLYETIQKTDKWVVIRGEVQKDSDLHYLRNAIGIVQALVEKGAIGVLDLQTFTLYTPSEWTSKIFDSEFDPYSHVVILASEMEDGSIWLHTRGMRKFGRPDISMEKLSKNEVDKAAQVINQMIFYSVLGAFFSRPVKLHTHNGLACIVKPEFVEDLDNPDFNNSYFRISWDECELESEIDK